MNDEERLHENALNKLKNGFVLDLTAEETSYLIEQVEKVKWLQQEINRITEERDQYFDDKILWSAALKNKNQELQQAHKKIKELEEERDEWFEKYMRSDLTTIMQYDLLKEANEKTKRLQEENTKLREQFQQAQANWERLKSFVECRLNSDMVSDTEEATYRRLFYYMNELEGES
jgi:chromosome segregation ATPase